MTVLTVCVSNWRLWFSDALREVGVYLSQMNTTQWGILSASAVLYGFYCMRSTEPRR